jgi:peptidoglycan/LPS O-acetylase OafA/YrhL
MKKIIAVEWLRGLASFGVCEMHMFCALAFFSKEDVFFQTYIFPISIMGRMGVPVFFVISGFIIPYSMWQNKYNLKQWANFIARRLIRLDPPYILSILLILFITFVMAKITGNTAFHIEWQNVLLHIGYINVFFNKPWLCGVYWTLAIEFQYYLLIALIFPLISHANRIVSIVSTLAFLGLFQVIAQYTPEYFIFKYIPLFIVGILVFQRSVNLLTNWQYIPQMIIVTAFLFIGHGKGYAIVAVLAAIIIGMDIDIKFKPLYFLGKISYSLYLIHWVIGIELIRFLAVYYFPEMNQATKILVALAGIFFSTAFALVFYNFIEKRSITWGKMLRNKNDIGK